MSLALVLPRLRCDSQTDTTAEPNDRPLHHLVGRDPEFAKDCKSAGAEAVFDEAADEDDKKFDTVIDVKKLPVDPANNCAPVFPHMFLRTNTIFDVARAAGHATAWADKHPRARDSCLNSWRKTPINSAEFKH